MSGKICNQAHVCKHEGCYHKVPHDGQCANPMPCRDFQRVPGKREEDAPISACVPVSTDGHYYTSERKWCGCCGGRGYTDITHTHKVPESV
jgi:hypothetical protein